VLLLVTGASGSGKSTTLAAIADRCPAATATCAEFDSVGVPAGADQGWRHNAVEHWVRRAVGEQLEGRHLILFGQVPVGELLAAPSADRLSGIAACLLHCSPATRRERLVARGLREDDLPDHIAFGEWFYRHMTDPTYRPEVIRVRTDVAMRWDRWSDWTASDHRWSFAIIDTDALTPEQTADRVAAWIEATLAERQPAIRLADGLTITE
jgi:energy-coupling factor transporter ATP-binding protein EcfA2